MVYDDALYKSKFTLLYFTLAGNNSTQIALSYFRLQTVSLFHNPHVNANTANI